MTANTMHKLQTILRRLSGILVLTLTLVACGGSSSHAQAQAVTACLQAQGTRAQCECFIGYAAKLGDDLGKLTNEIRHSTAATDQTAIKAGFACQSAH